MNIAFEGGKGVYYQHRYFVHKQGKTDSFEQTAFLILSKKLALPLKYRIKEIYLAPSKYPAPAARLDTWILERIFDRNSNFSDIV